MAVASFANSAWSCNSDLELDPQLSRPAGAILSALKLKIFSVMPAMAMS